jgi:UDP-N-acetyl-D-galactosamine dehydrogenase
MTLKLSDVKLAVIGLGYVGLPLAVEFGRHYPTIGFDINHKRINELKVGLDSSLEISRHEMDAAKLLRYTDNCEELSEYNTFIVTVPTPVDKHNQPDMAPLLKASEMVGKVIKKGDVVIYESTVYPGATEEDCIPVIEKASGLKFNIDFFAGYSPERINPGDKEHRFTNIKKVTSGSTPAVADFVDELYATVVVVGTHKVPSIKVAEAAKVIENTQRDVNIALINELAIIFNKMGIDSKTVLDAAATKWNFIPFRPGLVGGHCIGVDPYYLTHKAQELGYLPEVILAGRRINDGMGEYIAERVARLMMHKRIHVVGSKILVLGLSFKENCPDIRNTKVIDIVNEFKSFNATIDVYDPWVDSEEAEEEYGISLTKELIDKSYDAIVVAVAHRQFIEMGIKKVRALGKPNSAIFDVKCLFAADQVDGRL